MPLSRYPDPAPSPHLYPSPRDAKLPEHRKRKASLPQSLHRFAKHTFLRRPRHTTTDYSSVRTTPATSLTSGSCPASPAVPPSRSDGVMASGECPLGGSAVASGGRTRVQPPMTTTASSNGGGTMPRKAGKDDANGTANSQQEQQHEPVRIRATTLFYPSSPATAIIPTRQLVAKEPNSDKPDVIFFFYNSKPPRANGKLHKSLPEPEPAYSYVEDIQTISTAQPQQYWLGRFSTLVNAFHQEDAFKTKSDSITINYTISSPHPHPHASPYPFPSTPKQQPTHYIATSPTATLDDQRAKRAFIFLENACTTSEARKSFLEFRDVYTKRFGDRWTNWFVVEGHHGNGSTSDLSSGTLVSSLGNGEKGKIRKSSENGVLGAGGGGGGGIGLMNMFRTVRRSLV
ncbi:hypothetical protein FQN55_001175 [Onygenales sp. PD_40]|nr:hypothetical protein FQN55_001175 [Onygenales sp. PD_40]